MIIKEDQTIKTISKTLENVDSGSKTWKRGIKPVIMVVAFGVISSGLNGYLMWRVAMAKSLQAEVAAEAAVAAEVSNCKLRGTRTSYEHDNYEMQ